VRQIKSEIQVSSEFKMANGWDGARPGAGRKKGGAEGVQRPLLEAQRAARAAVNKAVIAAVELNQTPLEYMLAVFRDPTVDERRRDMMAMAAAPYVHAKLAVAAVKAEVHHTGPAEGQPLTPEQYRLWARQQIREAFGMPPLTIEHVEPAKAVDAVVDVEAVGGDVEASADRRARARLCR
jgi:phage terminase small subunit